MSLSTFLLSFYAMSLCLSFCLSHTTHRTDTSCLGLQYLCFYKFDCSRKFGTCDRVYFLLLKKKLEESSPQYFTFPTGLNFPFSISFNSKGRRNYDLASPYHVVGTALGTFMYSSHAIHIAAPENVLTLFLQKSPCQVSLLDQGLLDINQSQ